MVAGAQGSTFIDGKAVFDCRYADTALHLQPHASRSQGMFHA